MSYYSDKDYGILHDHCQAIARERDHANRRIVELEAQNLHYFNQGNLWMSMMHDLADHLGNALYSDEWRTREYAIVAFNAYVRANPEHEIDVDLRLDR
jgi:hypothetical protein